MKQKFFWPKLLGVTLLVHAVLILLSIIEVAIYSMIINPGHDQQFYSRHAEVSGPWISAIFGSILIFFFVRRYLLRFTHQHLTYALALPVIYTLTDTLIFIASGAGGSILDIQFIFSHVLKIVTGLAAYFLYAKHRRT